MFLFFLVWTGVIVLLIRLNAPLIFPIVFGLFDLLFIFVLLQLVFGRSRILISDGSISVRNSAGLFSTARTVPVSDIVAVKPSIGMQSGKSVRYSVKLTRRGGKDSMLWVTLSEKHDAEWLAAELRKQIGLLH